MTTVPLPPAASILSSIRTSSHTLRLSSNILIDSACVDAFLIGLKKSEWNAELEMNRNGIRLPLRFESDEEEINILATLSLLNFLSGYRLALHRLTTGRGSYSTILTLILSSYLTPSSTSPLTTSGMLACTPSSLASLMQIETHTEEDHPTLGPAVKMGKKDEDAWEVLELLVGVLRETGEVLKGQGKRSLGEWVREALLETLGDQGEMLQKLVETFPAFRDCYLIDGQPVYLFKKALFLLTAISLRFSSPPLDDSTKPVSFPLPQINNVPIFADNVIPTMLIHHKILNLSECADPALVALDLSNPSALLLSKDSATRLRAAAVDVCAVIVKRAHEIAAEAKSGEKSWLGSMLEVELDAWIWGMGKKTEFKEVGRVAERGTVFY